jgi:hypothetical protein
VHDCICGTTHPLLAAVGKGGVNEKCMSVQFLLSAANICIPKALILRNGLSEISKLVRFVFDAISLIKIRAATSLNKFCEISKADIFRRGDKISPFENQTERRKVNYNFLKNKI